MIALKNVTKTYGSGEGATHVLKQINLQIQEGEFIAIMGPSGSGKSTLLNILGALDVPSSGEYYYFDTDIMALSQDQLALYRRNILGFIFQGFNLLKKTSAIDNVEVPLIYQRIDAKDRKKRAFEALKNVGLEERVHYESGQLSGGQQQRVAIARAMVTSPSILIADEPTGNLDTKRGHEIMDLIKKFNEDGITIIMVTHEEDIATYASRIIYIRDGIIESDKSNVK